MGDRQEHVGDFAEGETRTHVERGALMGDFAAGQEAKPRTGTVQPRGDFAEGQEQRPLDPTAPRGDFARGHEPRPIDPTAPWGDVPRDREATEK
jgi:hypothetical protein